MTPYHLGRILGNRGTNNDGTSFLLKAVLDGVLTIVAGAIHCRRCIVTFDTRAARRRNVLLIIFHRLNEPLQYVY